MPIISISLNPNANSLNAAYRPIVLRVLATRTDGAAIPPAVFCDVYFGGVYYRSLGKQQYQETSGSNSEWKFDIQDIVQEYLGKFVANNGESNMVEATPLISYVTCKFRSSGTNSEGFIVLEGTAPIQATFNQAAVSGSGTESNSFYVVNATLQHEEDQDLATHLNTLKIGTWDADTYPLTHRPRKYLVCEAGSDYFPILTDLNPTDLMLHYRPSSSLNFLTSDGSLPCIEVSVKGQTPGDPPFYPILPDGVKDEAYTYSFELDGTAPFILSAITKPAWMTIGVSGSVLSITGTPPAAASGVSVAFTITNCGGHIDFADSLDITDVPTCVVVGGLQPVFPDAVVGVAYAYSLTLTGTTPLTLTSVVKPAWMTIGVSGNDIVFGGVPSNGDTGGGIAIKFTVKGCNSSSKSFTGDLRVVGAGIVDVSIATTGGYVRILWTEVGGQAVGPQLSGALGPVEPGFLSSYRCITGTVTVDVYADGYDALYTLITVTGSNGVAQTLPYTGNGTYHFTGVVVNNLTHLTVELA